MLQQLRQHPPRNLHGGNRTQAGGGYINVYGTQPVFQTLGGVSSSSSSSSRAPSSPSSHHPRLAPQEGRGDVEGFHGIREVESEEPGWQGSVRRGADLEGEASEAGRMVEEGAGRGVEGSGDSRLGSVPLRAGWNGKLEVSETSISHAPPAFSAQTFEEASAGRDGTSAGDSDVSQGEGGVAGVERIDDEPGRADDGGGGVHLDGGFAAAAAAAQVNKQGVRGGRAHAVFLEPVDTVSTVSSEVPGRSRQDKEEDEEEAEVAHPDDHPPSLQS